MVELVLFRIAFGIGCDFLLLLDPRPVCWLREALGDDGLVRDDGLG